VQAMLALAKRVGENEHRTAVAAVDKQLERHGGVAEEWLAKMVAALEAMLPEPEPEPELEQPAFPIPDEPRGSSAYGPEAQS